MMDECNHFSIFPLYRKTRKHGLHQHSASSLENTTVYLFFTGSLCHAAISLFTLQNNLPHFGVRTYKMKFELIRSYRVDKQTQIWSKTSTLFGYASGELVPLMAVLCIHVFRRLSYGNK